MNTEVKNTIKATDRDAQYDESAKRLLGQKIILAHILVKTVDEFKGMTQKQLYLLLRENLISAPYQWNRDLPIREARRADRK